MLLLGQAAQVIHHLFEPLLGLGIGILGCLLAFRGFGFRFFLAFWLFLGFLTLCGSFLGCGRLGLGLFGRLGFFGPWSRRRLFLRCFGFPCDALLSLRGSLRFRHPCGDAHRCHPSLRSLRPSRDPIRGWDPTRGFRSGRGRAHLFLPLFLPHLPRP